MAPKIVSRMIIALTKGSNRLPLQKGWIDINEVPQVTRCDKLFEVLKEDKGINTAHIFLKSTSYFHAMREKSVKKVKDDHSPSNVYYPIN
jgi:hypothetical protein